MTSSRLKVALRFLPLCLLGLVIWRERLWTVGLLRVPPWPVAAVIAINFAVYLPLKAARWRVALTDPPRFRQVWAATIEGLFANAAIGLGSGEVVRAARLRADRGRFAMDYGAALAERGAEVLALAILILMTTVMLPLGRLAPALASTAVLAYAGVLWAGGRLVSRVGRWPRVQAGLAAGLAASTPRRVAMMTFLSLVGWASETVMLVIFLGAFHLRADLGTALLTLVGINAAIVVPAVPGNFGTFEAGAAVAMMVRGVPRESAVAFAFAYHLIHVVPMAVVATSVFAMRNLRRTLRQRSATSARADGC